MPVSGLRADLDAGCQPACPSECSQISSAYCFLFPLWQPHQDRGCPGFWSIQGAKSPAEVSGFLENQVFLLDLQIPLPAVLIGVPLECREIQVQQNQTCLSMKWDSASENPSVHAFMPTQGLFGHPCTLHLSSKCHKGHKGRLLHVVSSVPVSSSLNAFG